MSEMIASPITSFLCYLYFRLLSVTRKICLVKKRKILSGYFLKDETSHQEEIHLIKGNLQTGREPTLYKGRQWQENGKGF